MKTEDKDKVKLYSNDYYYSKLLERLVIPKWQWEIAVNEAVSGGGGGSVNSVNGKTGTVILTGEDITISTSDESNLSSAIISNDENITTISNDVTNLKDTVVLSVNNNLPDENGNVTISGGGGISYATELPMSDTDATFVYDRITTLETTTEDLQTQIDSIDLSNYYTDTQVDTLLLTKADVATVDALDTRLTTAEEDINNLDSSVTSLDTELDTKADIVVQQPSCLTLLSTGTALALPTTYTTITFLENPLLVGTMMTSDLTTVTFAKAGFVDLQVTGEVTGAIEVQVLINGVVANLSHFVKITATDTYETLSVDIRRIEVAVDDTIEIQMQSTAGAFNNIILFMRESF